MPAPATTPHRLPCGSSEPGDPQGLGRLGLTGWGPAGGTAEAPDGEEAHMAAAGSAGGAPPRHPAAIEPLPFSGESPQAGGQGPRPRGDRDPRSPPSRARGPWHSLPAAAQGGSLQGVGTGAALPENCRGARPPVRTPGAQGLNEGLVARFVVEERPKSFFKSSVRGAQREIKSGKSCDL